MMRPGSAMTSWWSPRRCRRAASASAIAHHRTARPGQCTRRDQPDGDRRLRDSRANSRQPRSPKRPPRGRADRCRPHRFARVGAGHDRRQRRARFRRRGVGRARPDPANPGGWHLVVAIADVAAYVRPAARSTARRRGAATRSISPTASCRCCPRRCRTVCVRWCRARTGRAWPRSCGSIADGRKRRHRFERAVMRSAARLTYDAVQAAHDGAAGEPFPLAPERLAALYGAFAALDRARRARGALMLDLPSTASCSTATGGRSRSSRAPGSTATG